MLVHKTITGALGRLLWYSIVFKEHSRGLRVKISTTGALGTTEYYRSTGEAVLAQYNTEGALGRLCQYNRVL